jgi:hypothetical protein
MVFGSSGHPPTTTPLFVVGYTGWRTADAMKAQLAANPNVAGILIIDAGIFVSNDAYGGLFATGPVSLWGLIVALHRITNSLANASTDPLAYVM